jgi:hypothetical protein
MKNKKQNNKKQKVGVKVDMDKDLAKYAQRVNQDELGIIQCLGSKDIEMCEVSFQTDDKTFSKVADIGRDLIQSDKHKLFGYAIVRAIEDVIAEEKGKKCSRA